MDQIDAIGLEPVSQGVAASGSGDDHGGTTVREGSTDMGLQLMEESVVIAVELDYVLLVSGPSAVAMVLGDHI